MNRRPARANFYKFIALAVFFIVLIRVPMIAEAHPLNNGYSQIRIEGNHVSIELFIPENSVVEWRTQKNKVSDYLRDHLQLTNHSEPMSFQLLSTEQTEKETIPGSTFKLEYTSDRPIDSLTIHYSLLFDDADPAHINFAMIMNGDDMDQTLWSSSHRTYHYEPLQKVSLWTSLWEYLELGVKHILSGSDHLLFVLSLLLIASKVSDILKIITAFTIAHSVTLFLASEGIISVKPQVVESAIALTIAYVAAENCFRAQERRRWLLTFAFGLIHGMGFAGALKEVGLPQNNFIGSLLSFNVGVELGQLSLVAVALPMLLRLRRFTWYRKFVYTVSGFIFLIALYWFFQRIGWL
jgi:hydrogenase/urease accessory protein HupE